MTKQRKTSRTKGNVGVFTPAEMSEFDRISYIDPADKTRARITNEQLSVELSKVGATKLREVGEADKGEILKFFRERAIAFGLIPNF